MKINRIGELFSLVRNGEGAQGQASSQQVQSQGSENSAEATRVANDFGSGSSPAQEAARQRRLEELKQKVSEGTYKPKSEDVAKSVFQDLFA